MVRASDSSFRIAWTESAYERGSLAERSRWTAMVTVKVQAPRSADILRKNPLGLYVEAIDWSRELETPGPSPVERSAVAPVTPKAPSTPSNIQLGLPPDANLARPRAAPAPERTTP